MNKIDLLPHLDFDLDKFLHHLDAVHPGVPRLLVSARTGEGVDEWRDWLVRGGAAGAGPGVTRASRSTRCSSGASRPARAFFAAEADADRARSAASSRERFVARRAAARRRRLAAGLVGRAPRRGRVRPPGDRRQARAARARASQPAELGLLRRARRRGRSRSSRCRVRARRGRGRFEPPTTTRSCAQELAETLYHVLWELVHVFLDHLAGSTRGRRRLGVPLPVPRRQRTRPLDDVVADVRALGR